MASSSPTAVAQLPPAVNIQQGTLSSGEAKVPHLRLKDLSYEFHDAPNALGAQAPAPAPGAKSTQTPRNAPTSSSEGTSSRGASDAPIAPTAIAPTAITQAPTQAPITQAPAPTQAPTTPTQAPAQAPTTQAPAPTAATPSHAPHTLSAQNTLAPSTHSAPSNAPSRATSNATAPSNAPNAPKHTTRKNSRSKPPRAAAVAAAGLDDEVLVGTRVSEGHGNFVTAYNMLSGIRVAVSRCTAKNNRQLTLQDFTTNEEISFDMRGGGQNPSSKYMFHFKDYSPWVFRHLRELFKLDPADYLMSLTAKYIMSELGSPGKSGSFFYYSRDYRFIIKTIRHSEHKLLRRILKQYYEHAKSNPDTLISQFYGLHRVRLPFGRKIHFVVMNNVFPALYEIHERYDLKGSLKGREYTPDSKPIVVYKDLDWLRNHKRIVLGPTKRERIVKQLEKDIAFLKAVNVMDYSLLIGIHDMSKGNSALKSLFQLDQFGPGDKESHGSGISNTQREFIELQSLLKKATPEKLKEFDFADEYRSEFYFYKDHGGFQSTNDHNESLDVIYYIGVIDFLTGYTFKKSIETFCKSLVNDRKELSAVPANEYGDRFLKFLRGSIGPAIPSTLPHKKNEIYGQALTTEGGGETIKRGVEMARRPSVAGYQHAGVQRTSEQTSERTNERSE